MAECPVGAELRPPPTLDIGLDGVMRGVPGVELAQHLRILCSLLADLGGVTLHVDDSSRLCQAPLFLARQCDALVHQHVAADADHEKVVHPSVEEFVAVVIAGQRPKLEHAHCDIRNNILSFGLYGADRLQEALQADIGATTYQAHAPEPTLHVCADLRQLRYLLPIDQLVDHADPDGQALRQLGVDELGNLVCTQAIQDLLHRHAPDLV
mmetsp:Transcript_68393/g.198261  ORF Transcript_68393/g.198261 Transcript_68393/m.198261 type:complete len:210 (+) Transcript_68393:484-1113(+)